MTTQPGSRGILSVLTHSSLGIIDQGIISAGRFGLGLWLAMKMTPDSYGAFSLGFSALLLCLSSHHALLLDPMLIRAPGMSSLQSQVYFGACARAHWLLCLAGIGVATVLFAAAYGFGMLARGQVGVAGVLVLCGVAYLTQAFLRTLLFIQGDLGWVLFSDLACVVLPLGVIFILAQSGTVSLATVFATMAIAALVGAMIAGHRSLLLKGGGAPWREGIKAARDNLKIGKWLFGASTSFWVMSQAGLFFSAAQIGAAATASLRACQNLLAPTHLVLMGLDGIMTPAASRRFQEGGLAPLGRYLRQSGLVLALALGAYTLVILAAPGRILDALYGGKYDNAALVSLIATQYLFYGLMKPFTTGLKVTGRSRAVFATHLLSGVLALGLTPLLISRFGVRGAALAALLSAAIGAVALVIAYFATRPSHQGSSIGSIPIDTSLDQL